MSEYCSSGNPCATQQRYWHQTGWEWIVVGMIETDCQLCNIVHNGCTVMHSNTAHPLMTAGGLSISSSGCAPIGSAHLLAGMTRLTADGATACTGTSWCRNLMCIDLGVVSAGFDPLLDGSGWFWSGSGGWSRNTIEDHRNESEGSDCIKGRRDTRIICTHRCDQ